MGLYNFSPEFVPFILDGTKVQTIRQTRKHPDKPGNFMHLYTGLRTKASRLLLRARCAHVGWIDVHPDGIYLDGLWLTADACNKIAWHDGFRSGRRAGAFARMRLFIESKGIQDEEGVLRGKIYFWDWPGLIKDARNCAPSVQPGKRKSRQRKEIGR